MNELERSGLAGMRDCWITGGAAAGLAPTAWSELVGSGTADERERQLLAIAGQAFAVALRPAAPKTLIVRAPLPVLSLPILPQRLRQLFRAAMRQVGDARAALRAAALLASRGFVAHPLDWMPTASDVDAPVVYAPWIDWQTEAASLVGPMPDRLNAENWEEFLPAARRSALAEMRRSAPAAALALLAAKAATEPAETRLALVELLQIGLSAADSAYLESLAGDRSGKVRQLAAQFLARIGRGAAGNEADAAELAEFIEQRRAGVIRRRTVFAPTKKSPAQQQRRAELFEISPLFALVAKLSVTESEFIAGWQLDVEERVDYELARMVVASGSDEAVAQLARRLISAGLAVPLKPLLPRLGEPELFAMIRLLLSKEPRLLTWPDSSAPIVFGRFGREELMTGVAYKQMRRDIADGDEHAQFSSRFALPTLGLLADAAAAQAILNDLIAAGLAPADPALALLRLNAALTDQRPATGP